MLPSAAVFPVTVTVRFSPKLTLSLIAPCESIVPLTE